MRLLALVLVLLCFGCSATSTSASGDAVTAAASGFPLLPAPSAIRATSAVVNGVLARGAQYNTDLPRNRIIGAWDGRAGLSSAWSKGAPDLAACAYAVYSMDASGRALDNMLHISFDSVTEPAAGTCWAGLPSFSRDGWFWTAVTPGVPLALDSDNFDNGLTHIVVLLTSNGLSTLRTVRLGEIVPSPHDAATAGVTEILGGYSISRVAPSNPTLEPFVWGGVHAIGGDKLGLQRTLPSPGFGGYFGAGRVAVWSGHEGYFGSGPDGDVDDVRFREQLFAWLLASRTRVGFTDTHGEWLTHGNFSPEVKSLFDGQGVTHGPVTSVLDATVLSGYDCIVIGNPWGTITPAERDALSMWVECGGSLLVLSLGWSWGGARADYPPNQLGAIFGWEIMGGTLEDSDAPNGNTGQPSFNVGPLSEYTPAKIVVLKKGVDDLTSVTALSVNAPQDIYVLEGDFMGLQLLNDDWADLDDPAEAIDILDGMYSAQVAMVRGYNRPFKGDNVWIIPQYVPGAGWYMHSGNPIVMIESASEDVKNGFNDNANAGWGLAHEMGHNMHLDACGYLFGADAIEPCANIFTVRTFERMGWDLATGGHSDYFQEGYDYHALANPSYDDMKASAWIFLGLLDLIWKKYGWAGMETFLAYAAQDTAGGLSAPDDAFRCAYLIENLSHTYDLDFSPLFTHWDFPVTDETRAITDVYPDADIPW